MPKILSVRSIGLKPITGSACKHVMPQQQFAGSDHGQRPHGNGVFWLVHWQFAPSWKVKSLTLKLPHPLYGIHLVIYHAKDSSQCSKSQQSMRLYVPAGKQPCLGGVKTSDECSSDGLQRHIVSGWRAADNCLQGTQLDQCGANQDIRK